MMRWVKFYELGNAEGMPAGWPWQMVENGNGPSPGAGWVQKTDAEISAIKASLQAEADVVFVAKLAASAAERQPAKVSSINATGLMTCDDGSKWQLYVDKSGYLRLTRSP